MGKHLVMIIVSLVLVTGSARGDAVGTGSSMQDRDGFIVIDTLDALRSRVTGDDQKIRLKPGTYQLDTAQSKHFIKFTGNGNHYDFKDVTIRVSLELFRQFGAGGMYCALSLTGDHNILEALTIETYGVGYGVSGRNKLFNVTGSHNTIRDCLVRTHGSHPWGYGSLFGIGGGMVRKMNGIRVGWPADGTRLIGCRVEMRAMGHAIFVQGAKNTLIEDCHVDGLLRMTDDILKEDTGVAHGRDFLAVSKIPYVEGTMVGDDLKIVPGEIVSLSEDGIRMYGGSGSGQKTGPTTVKDCTVTNMRRGICTGLSDAGDRVINCRANHCIATGFNVGTDDVLIHCRADAKFGEAVCLPYPDSKNAKVELEILDSRNGMANTLLAKINGSAHQVTLNTADPEFIPSGMTIELASPNGYGSHLSGRMTTTNVTLNNQTSTKVVLFPDATDNTINSQGPVVDEGQQDNTVTRNHVIRN